MKKEDLKLLIESSEKDSQKIRGEVLIDCFEYIKEKEGAGGLERLKERLKDLLVLTDLEKVSPSDWISSNLCFAIIIVAKDIFRWEERDVFEMGLSAPRFPLPLRMLVQTIMDPKKMFKELPIYWKNIFNFGFLDPAEFNEDLQHAKIVLRDFKTVDPIIGKYLEGYFKGLGNFMFNKEVDVRQTKSTHNQDDCDEYIIYY